MEKHIMGLIPIFRMLLAMGKWKNDPFVSKHTWFSSKRSVDPIKLAMGSPMAWLRAKIDVCNKLI